MNQLTQLISGLSNVQKLSIIVALVAVGGVIAVVMHSRTESDFHPLYTAMAPEDAAPVVQKLKESGVEYRLGDNGASVLVPSAKLAESRLTLAGAGLPKSGRIGFELFDKANFGATELVEHINYQRALEGELERSVLSMSEVVQARIHLTLPKESVFLDQQQPSKASVMIKLRSGAQLSPQNVMAVANLVSSAVEGLSPDAVAIVDMDGHLLNRPRRTNTDDSQVTSEALEVRQQIERDLVAKINSTLEPLLGLSQFRAGASVECDLTSGEQQEETFDPDKSVMVTSQKSDDSTDRPSAGGIPGTTSNLPHPPDRAGGAGVAAHHTENVTYQTSRIVRHTRIPQGVIKRMSLSVLVGQEVKWEGTGNSRHAMDVPPTLETLKSIHDIVAGVTGFNSERGDQLIVETLPFESTVMADPEKQTIAPQPKKSPDPAWITVLGKYYIPIVLAILVVSIGTIVFRAVKAGKRRSAASTVEAAAELPGASEIERLAAAREILFKANEIEGNQAMDENSGRLVEPHRDLAERIRELASNDMNATANVMRMWLQDQKI